MNTKIVYKFHDTKWLLDVLFIIIQTYIGIVNTFYELPRGFFLD